jgi:hypothetical protein
MTLDRENDVAEQVAGESIRLVNQLCGKGLTEDLADDGCGVTPEMVVEAVAETFRLLTISRRMEPEHFLSDFHGPLAHSICAALICRTEERAVA